MWFIITFLNVQNVKYVYCGEYVMYMCEFACDDIIQVDICFGKYQRIYTCYITAHYVLKFEHNVQWYSMYISLHIMFKNSWDKVWLFLCKISTSINLRTYRMGHNISLALWNYLLFTWFYKNILQSKCNKNNMLFGKTSFCLFHSIYVFVKYE